MTFEGIAASPGIGVGPIVRYVPEDLSVREGRVADDRVDAELARFHGAIEASRADLASIRNRIAAELGEAEAAIYDAHLMMLDDPDLKRAVEAGIRDQRQHAGFAFRAYMSHVATHLGNIEDEYLRERRADVLDVERRVLRHLLGGGPRPLEALERPSVIVAHDLPPSEVALLDRTRVLGFVTEVGSRTSHCSIVARGRGIPAVVSARGVMQFVKDGDLGAVDGFRGRFELNPGETERVFYAAECKRLDHENRLLQEIHDQRATTLDGHTVELGVNIEQPGEADNALAAGADGVGLFRTEFFYLNRLELPSEEEQYEAYRHVAERLAPRPVIFRTMDLGGDKVASYLGMTHETNPFLGWRGIRFALHHPDVFRAQLRALYRASAHGRMRVMFPMVSSENELLRARSLCTEARAELDRAGHAYDADLELGIMIETPSAVWMADVLARNATFFSIGSNDLTQYTLAMDRDNERMAHLYEPLEPAVLRSIRHTVDAARHARRWVGVCGEMAGDPRTAVLLTGLGVDELSMSSFDLPRVKLAIRSVTLAEARALAALAVEMSSAEAVKALLAERLESDADRRVYTRGAARMSALEPPFGAHDASGMLARIVGLPEQIEEAVARCAANPWRLPAATPDLVAVGALGGSAIGADLSAGLYADRLPRPLLTVREYEWPACVGRGSLAVLSSYSGNTEETLALYREAGMKQIPRAAITTGGALAAACARDGVPYATMPGGSPPRAALFSSWVTLTHLLAALGWVDAPGADWRAAAAGLRRGNAELGPDVPEATNPAKRMARALQGRLAFLYAGSGRLGPVVTRVRNQINENAKLLGHSAVVPELNHNEIVGWEVRGALQSLASVLLLRDREDGAEVERRLTLTAEYVREQGAEVHEWQSRGESRIERLASLVQFGDYLSFYLAMLNGVDPTPIASIDAFKRRLATP